MPFTKENGCVAYRPSSYDRTKQYPCIILLHGIGERGDGSDAGLNILLQFITSEWNNIAKGLEKYPNFLLVAPQLAANKGEWDNATVQKGVDYALTNLNANPKRLYLVGISLGGGGVMRYADASIENARKFACLVSICGVYGLANGGKYIAAGAPVWMFHAKDDTVVGYGLTTGQAGNINANNPKIPAKTTLYDTGNHYIWARVFDPNNSPGNEGENVNLWQWFELNEQGSPVAVPKGAAAQPTNNSTVITLKAVAEVANITKTTATLDGTKSTGQYNWAEWEMILPDPKTHAPVFPNWNKGGITKEVTNLLPGTDYRFVLKLHAENNVSSVDLNFKTSPIFVSPVFIQSDIPAGKTKVIVREDKTVEFI